MSEDKSIDNGHDRLDHIDIAKGIAILLVIVGYTFTVWKIKVNWIFSFHMPLFFIMSGFFFKDNKKTEYKKLFKSLIIPYLFLNFFKLMLMYIANHEQVNLYRQFAAIAYGNAFLGAKKLCIVDVPIIGMTWFLLALFWCKIIYNELNKIAEKIGIPIFWIVALLAFGSIQLSKFVWLPFSIMPGVTAMLFYHIGREIRRKNIFDLKLSQISPIIIILSLILWECSCTYGYLRLNENRIKLLTDIFSAVIGTYYVVVLSKAITSIPIVNIFFKWCGKYSLAILGVHSLDGIIMYEVCKIIPSFNIINSWGEYFIYMVVRIGSILILAFGYIFAKSKIKVFMKNKKIAM